MFQSCNPMLLMSEIFYPKATDANYMADALARAVDIGFYKGIETGMLPAGIAKRVGAIVEQHHLRHVQWLTRELLENRITPCSVDKEERKKTVEFLCELTKKAADGGAHAIALVSGDDPGEGRREEARKALLESLHAMARVLTNYPGIELLLEPLDRTAHKRQLIGPTEEAVQLAVEMRTEFGGFGLSWDTAHVALCDEALADSLKRALPWVGQIHFAEAVTRKGHPIYGDYHIIPEHPDGILSVSAAAALLKQAREGMGHPAWVSVEARTAMDADGWETERQCRDFIQRAIQKEAEIP